MLATPARLQRRLRIAGALSFAAALTWAFTESACPSYKGATRLHQTRGYLRFIESEIEGYRAMKGRLPDDLRAIMDARRPYEPHDRWGRDLVYRKESSGYRVYSVGRNGIDEAGAGDDVLSNASPKQYTCEQYEEECVTACHVAKYVSMPVAIIAALALAWLSFIRRNLQQARSK